MRSLAAGSRSRSTTWASFADGVAVRRVGDETFRICRETVDEIVLVNTDETCAAIQDIFEDTRTIVEPAGALAVAGLQALRRAQGLHGQTLVTVNCGANMNFDRLRHVAERAAIGEQREALMAVDDSGTSGQLSGFLSVIGERNVTEFNYRYARPTAARVFVGLELRHGAASGRDRPGLRGAGLPGGRHERRRDGEDCTCATWWAARRRASPTSAVPFRIPGTPRRAIEVP